MVDGSVQTFRIRDTVEKRRFSPCSESLAGSSVNKTESTFRTGSVAGLVTFTTGVGLEVLSVALNSGLTRRRSRDGQADSRLTVSGRRVSRMR